MQCLCLLIPLACLLSTKDTAVIESLPCAISIWKCCPTSDRKLEHRCTMTGKLRCFVGDPSGPPYNFSLRNPLGQIWTNGNFTVDGPM